MAFFHLAHEIPSAEPFDHATGRITGLILAISGSKGVPLKNIKPLAGEPLIKWALTSMQDSKVFDRYVTFSLFLF